MTTTEPVMQESDVTPTDRDLEQRRAIARRRVSRAMTTIGSGVTTLAGRAPGAMRATRARASEATSVLQRLPDSSLRWLAAGSLGVAAGFHMAGAPRLVRAAGAVPAVFLGAAIALRRPEVGVPTPEQAEGSAEGAGTTDDA